MIVGKRVRLRPVERDDLPRFVAWLGDPEVCANLALLLGPGLAQEERWFERVLALPPLEQPLAVEALEDGGVWRHVGSAGVHGVDWRNRSAEIGLVLGDKSVWDRGLGTELTELLLRHAFADLNLHRVWLRVFADNPRARRVYEKAGLRLEGAQREADYRDGRYRDVLLYSVLAPEWRARRVGTSKPSGRSASMGEQRGFEVAVIGGGIVGMATAMALVRHGKLRVAVVEKEPRLAAHQTGNNSGVIHSGLYYKPGSLKARNCTSGREALYRFCAEHGIAAERCGKVVVATKEEQLPALEELWRRGEANGLAGLRRLRPEEIREIEPHAAGIAGLFVPQTGIVDYTRVTEAYAEEVRRAGSEIVLGARVRRVVARSDGMTLETGAGALHCRFLINCAGLQSDRVARLCGAAPNIRIVPFRGEYYELRPERTYLVKNLLYPVPDPEFPFLGVHFTRMISGGVEAGPNAVLALKREGYSRWSFSPRDVASTFAYPGFWKMATSYWRMGLGEFARSWNKRGFVRALQALVPAIETRDVEPAGAGVRAQALAPSGKLLDDFCIVEAARQIHVLNAPSPAATASIAIGETIAGMAVANFGLT